jgi:hypothetical protein
MPATTVRYSLTLPMRDNNGADLTAQHKRACTRLLAHFGAFTAHSAEGAWSGVDREYTEPVVVYTVDAPDDSESFARLHALATCMRAACRQEAIYLTRQPVETWLV